MVLGSIYLFFFTCSCRLGSNMMLGSMGLVLRFHFFTCSCQDFSVPLIEEAMFSLFYILSSFVID